MTYFRDLTIVDLTRVLSGPACTMYFADMGANVIKVEPPAGDDTRQWGPPFVGGESSYFLSVNRNKRSIVLDLKTEKGKEVLRKMIQSADVVVENFKPGTLERLGFGYSELKKLNSRVILASISGFGQTGPYRSEPGYDLIAQGMSGFMSVTGERGGTPLKGGFSLADLGTGMWATIGILTAIYHRDRTGEPQWIDTSLLETMMSWQTYFAGNYFATGKDPAANGNVHPNICPYQSFPAKDGHFNLAVGNEHLWHLFCDAMEKPEWKDDPRFRTNADRVQNRDALVTMLEGEFQKASVAEWVELFRSCKIPSGPIYKFSDLYNDPYVLARHMVVEAEHQTAGTLRSLGVPVKFHESETAQLSVSAPPLLGQHTEEILREFGFRDADIEEVMNNRQG